MLTVCTPRHSHGRLFLFNTMVTSKWRAKLSEYALDPYLKLTRGRLGEAGGIDLQPPEEHPTDSVLFLSPEKCSGEMGATVQPQIWLPPTAEPIAPRHGWAAGLRRRATHRSPFAATAPVGAQPAEPASGSPGSSAGCSSAVVEDQTQGARRMGEQRADVWAFGCLLTRLALHSKRAKQHSKQHSKMTTDDQLAEDMYGWKEDESVSKDVPGKDLPGRFTSRSKLVAATTLPEPAAAVLAAEDRPLSRRIPRVHLKFQAIGELSRHLKTARRISEAGSDHIDSNATSAPPPSAPPSPPETSPTDADAAPALTSVGAHETSAEEYAAEHPNAEVSAAIRTQTSAEELENAQSSLIAPRSVAPPGISRRQQRGHVTFAPNLPQRASSWEPQGAAESDAMTHPALNRSVSALQLGPAATAFRRVKQSRALSKSGAQPADVKEATRRPAPTRYVVMLRLCQDKVSPLDGVTLSCCPRPLLQLATQCCSRDPEERPCLAAVLEQLHGRIILSVDAPAHGVGARRPLPACEGWTDAVERTWLRKEPMNDHAGVFAPDDVHAAGSDYDC